MGANLLISRSLRRVGGRWLAVGRWILGCSFITVRGRSRVCRLGLEVCGSRAFWLIFRSGAAFWRREGVT